MEATGWQKHTVRGFISILGSEGAMKVTSTRRESDGARVYEAQVAEEARFGAAWPRGWAAFFVSDAAAWLSMGSGVV